MSERVRTILGIDPGIALLGYGVVESRGESLAHLEHGCVATPSGTALPARLRALYEGLSGVIRRYSITDVAMESLFHSRNVTTAVSVGQARGVAMLATVCGDTAYAEYTPTAVKQLVTGYGRASKRQMQEMIRLLLRLDSLPTPDDAADALAVAICHARRADLDAIVSNAAARAQ
ncbi:MAG TPA: crossover junction endodeoxyribonuclease RuvC [Chloroflexota bacterium]|nr:crossover junction endodeoxyribonuclease RuvC [Chloroflexota bacterium]